MVVVLSWLVVTAVTALVLAAVVVPRLAGATPYTVLTGSMAPAYPAGTLVVVRPVDAADVRIGDVVTYQLRSGEPEVATHRVVGVGWSATGERLLTTRGDANSVADAEAVRAVQLRGEVWYSLPWVGRLNVLFTPDQHRLLVRLAAGSLLVYAGVVLLRGWRARPGRRGSPSADASADAGGVLVPSSAVAATQPVPPEESARWPHHHRRPHVGRHAGVGS